MRRAGPLDDMAPQKLLAPTWELVHILGSVVTARARVIEIAAQSHLTMPALVRLDYLRRAQGWAMPHAAVDALAADACAKAVTLAAHINTSHT